MQRRPQSRLMATAHGDVPDRPIEPLVPFVTAQKVSGETVDWSIDPDVHSRLDPELLDLHREWRRRWTRSEPLESLHNTARLNARVDETRPAGVGTTWFDAVSRLLATGEPEVVAADELEALRADCGGLREMIQQSEGIAPAAVDTTPGSGRVGLAVAWAVDRVEQVVAADDDMSVVVTPDGGLLARGSALVEIALDEVTLGSKHVSIGSGPERHHLPIEHAHPLTWLVPDALSWRVRRVPEVLVWASTFAVLPDLCEESLALGRSVTLWIDSA